MVLIGSTWLTTGMVMPMVLVMMMARRVVMMPLGLDCRPAPSVVEGPEPRRRAALPVGAKPRRGAFQVQQHDLGQEHAVPAVPLQRELHVGSRRVAVLGRVAANVVIAVDYAPCRGRAEKPRSAYSRASS